jgi:hypothetical protein
MNGGNMSTESILPTSWGYDANDSINMLAIHKKYGKEKLNSFPKISVFNYFFWYPFVKKMQVIRPLEYIDYDKAKVKQFLIDELGWRDYGGKHYESTFTKFFQAHYLPVKFGFDKRKAHLSSLIVSGQMTRDEAILELQKPLYDERDLDEDRIYFIKKLGISLNEYEEIMNRPPSNYNDFPNNQAILDSLRKMNKVLGISKFFKK